MDSAFHFCLVRDAAMSTDDHAVSALKRAKGFVSTRVHPSKALQWVALGASLGLGGCTITADSVTTVSPSYLPPAPVYVAVPPPFPYNDLPAIQPPRIPN